MINFIIILIAVGYAEEKITLEINLKSPVFLNQEEIPKKYTQEGENLSPPLEWNNVPNKTKEIVIICDDSDIENPVPWVHWVLYGISPKLKKIPTGIKKKKNVLLKGSSFNVFQGVNSFKNNGYDGPKQISNKGIHKYFFKIYAIDKTIDFDPTIGKDKILQLIRGHVLSYAEIIGKK